MNYCKEKKVPSTNSLTIRKISIKRVLFGINLKNPIVLLLYFVPLEESCKKSHKKFQCIDKVIENKRRPNLTLSNKVTN